MKNRLLDYAFWLDAKYNLNVLQANTNHILDYFTNIVDKKDTLQEYKQGFRHLLNVYYKYVKEIREKIEQKTFINPVPSRHLYKFEEKVISIEELEQKNEVLDSYETVERVLNYIYFTRHRLYIIVSIMLYTGARISEAISIEILNIDLKERYFYVKVKSKKSANKWGLYFLPKFFMNFLKIWIEKIKIEYPDTKYLFPSPRTKSYLHSSRIREELRDIRKRLNLSCKINPHVFRDFLNTERFDNNLNKKYRTLLLNQTPKDVNPKHYLKKYKKRKKLQEIYDRSFPFPEFKPKTNLMRS